MQNKTLIVLIAIISILATIWGATTYLPRFTPTPSFYAEKVKSFDKNVVQSIVIKNSSGSLELKKESGVWKVNGKRADTIRVNSLISELFPSVFPEIIAQTDKRHKEFELTKDTATSIVFDDKLTWLVGKNTGTAVYTRFDGDNNVYLLKLVTSNLSTQATDWYDKTIISFDQSKASKLTFKETSKTITLIKKEDKWVDEATSKEAKKDKVNSVLSQVSSLSAQSLYNSPKGQSYPITPTLTLTIEFDGKSETLEFYKGSSDYLIKRLSDREQFIVGEYSVSSVITGPKEVFN
jgi:hypothetical protein